MTDRIEKRVIVALGGNAISPPDGDGSVREDYENLTRSLKAVVALVERGYQVILTHGNGPQVGNQMIRVERTLEHAPDLPLPVMVADIQGGLGYMMEQVLRERLAAQNLQIAVCCLVTLVEVDRNDPALENPSKFVGPVMRRDRALRRQEEENWAIGLDAGRGWRRVVPSPEPTTILEHALIAHLVDFPSVVIACGGGGVPVYRMENGELFGVSGVVDKDRASAVLGREIQAAELFVLTAVPKVALDFGTPQQRWVDQMTVSEARAYLAERQFPPGSMGPKVEAACRFVEQGGRRALITDIYTLIEALDGETGTWIVPDS